MLERQDLDALLVGALYGELSSADEARLTAHLDSHPTDRSALDDLKSAHQTVRQKVATSRIFELQLDPPQALSALLLQEAARRAPKFVSTPNHDSWFQRFVRSFIAHPAMAAAATLVLVVGVGSMIYLKKGQPQLAEQTTAQNVDRNATPTATVSPSYGVAAGSAASAGDVTTGKDSVAVNLDDNTEGHGGKGKGEARLEAGPQDQTKTQATPAEAQAATQAANERERALGFASDGKRGQVLHQTAPTSPPANRPEPKKKPYVEVPPPADPQPKELDDFAKNDARSDKAEKAGETRPGRSMNGAGGASAPAAPTIASGEVAQAGSPAATAEPPPPPVKAAEADTTWAKDQHAKITTLVKAGKCGEAVPLATALRSRAPAYFAANVMTDRQLKSCMQYVNETGNADRMKTERHSEPAAATKAR